MNKKIRTIGRKSNRKQYKTRFNRSKKARSAQIKYSLTIQLSLFMFIDTIPVMSLSGIFKN